MRISDWSSDVCSSDLGELIAPARSDRSNLICPPEVILRENVTKEFILRTYQAEPEENRGRLKIVAAQPIQPYTGKKLHFVEAHFTPREGMQVSLRPEEVHCHASSKKEKLIERIREILADTEVKVHYHKARKDERF